MATAWVEGNERPCAVADVPALLAEHAAGTAYFWVEAGDATLEAHHVERGASGFFLVWTRDGGRERLEPRREPRAGDAAGIALSFDGGGVPRLVDAAAVLPVELATRVYEAFVRGGGARPKLSGLVWGRAVVRAEGDRYSAFAACGAIHEVGEVPAAKPSRFTLPSLLALEATAAPADGLWQAAAWRVVRFAFLPPGAATPWLTTLAAHPMRDLASLSIYDEIADAAAGESLAAALAVQPALTRLQLPWPALAAIRALRSTTLRTLALGRAWREGDREPIADEYDLWTPPDGWGLADPAPRDVDALARVLRDGSLPALRSICIHGEDLVEGIEPIIAAPLAVCVVGDVSGDGLRRCAGIERLDLSDAIYDDDEALEAILARRDGQVTRLPYLPDGWAEQLEDAGVAFDLGGDAP